MKILGITGGVGSGRTKCSLSGRNMALIVCERILLQRICKKDYNLL